MILNFFRGIFCLPEKTCKFLQRKATLLLQSFLPSGHFQEHIRSIGIVYFVFPTGSNLPTKPYAPRPEMSQYFFPRDPEHIAYAGDANGVLDLLTVSLRAGYFDYQYMVKDYRKFTRQALTAFFDLEAKAPEKTFGLSDETS